MTFRSTYLKLTAAYVAIVMVISIFFSAILYRISSQELERGLARQTRFFRQLPPDTIIPLPLQDIERNRIEQLTESNTHLRLRLIYFNVLILVLSSAASYAFAKRTLHPIEEMLEAQNRFTADASHELRTPLTAMRSEIEVALRDKKLTAADAKKLLTSNLEEIDKLESLSGALLRLAKYEEAGTHQLQSISLREIIAEAYEKIESLSKKKSIRFRTHIEDVALRGDRESFVELFIILFDNAIKYSNAHTTVSVHADRSGEITVADHGIGIEASDLPHVFDRFYRVDNSRTKNNTNGYGLGLSIAKQIVELHGGSISVSSKPTKGSVFTVKLPI